MGDLKDIDFNDLARRLSEIPRKLQPGDACLIAAAIDSIRGLPFPDGYLDEVCQDMLRTAQRGGRVTTYVYLAFFGSDDKASHLKIGIAKNVRSRLNGIKTGNPLTNLWTYSAELSSRQDAEEIEAALLRHMSPQKVHGEWVNVHGLSQPASEAVVQSLSEVAGALRGHEVAFMPQWVRS